MSIFDSIKSAPSSAYNAISPYARAAAPYAGMAARFALPIAGAYLGQKAGAQGRIFADQYGMTPSGYQPRTRSLSFLNPYIPMAGSTIGGMAGEALGNRLSNAISPSSSPMSTPLANQARSAAQSAVPSLGLPQMGEAAGQALGAGVSQMLPQPFQAPASQALAQMGQQIGTRAQGAMSNALGPNAMPGVTTRTMPGYPDYHRVAGPGLGAWISQNPGGGYRGMPNRAMADGGYVDGGYVDGGEVDEEYADGGMTDYPNLPPVYVGGPGTTSPFRYGYANGGYANGGMPHHLYLREMIKFLPR